MDDIKHTRLLEALTRRLARIKARQASVSRSEARYPWIRLAAVIAGGMGSYLALETLPLLAALPVVACFLAVFIIVVSAHRKVIDAMARYAMLGRLGEERIARAEINWSGIPPAQHVDVSPTHPFDRDLIVTGERSLHQLIDVTASVGGSLKLAAWLLEEKPDRLGAARRQSAVRDLLARPAFRARLALDGALISLPRFDAAPLLKWLESETTSRRLGLILLALLLLAAADLAFIALSLMARFPPIWIITFLLYFGLQAYTFRESSEVFGASYDLSKRLGQLRRVLTGIEQTRFAPGSELDQVAAPIQKSATRPSQALRRIGWIASAASIHNNPVLSLVFNILVPWDLFFAYQLGRFKASLRGLLPGWLDAWYCLEALSSLAELAYLNPGYAFPALQPPGDAPIFSARSMGHPLIPYPERVTNDFSFDRLGEAGLITGSNMSGKSTFLRTVGANLILAFAGGPVAAEALSAVPFRLFASMNVSDSLSDGISYFYAEVRRLKALLDALHAPGEAPLFYLIDEIFRGTNNRERRVGSEAYLRALLGGNGVGLIATHDLELVRLAEEIANIRNYHFREDVAGERMVFDYRLRSGASPTTNALRIMALAGLPVEPHSEKRAE